MTFSKNYTKLFNLRKLCYMDKSYDFFSEIKRFHARIY